MKVDYDKVAPNYDNHRQGSGPYLDRLVSLAREAGAGPVLEVGAGTGNNTHAFAQSLPCFLTALEPSEGMLAHGKAKNINAQWVRGSLQAVPVATTAVRFIFGVYVLHHIPDLVAALAECSRVLGHGCAAFITASEGFIDHHPMNEYFPSFAAVDRARFQPVAAVADAFGQAGFSRVESESFVAAPRPIGTAYVDKVAAKFISTYDLLPPQEYADGLARLRADVARQGSLDTPLAWESVAVWGWV